MKSVWVAVLLFMSAAGFACNEKGAFGVTFGKRVPEHASREQRDGGSVKNAMGFFDGEVPEPMPGFTHGYGANRDRSFVYAVDAKRKFYDSQQGKAPEEERKAALEKIKLEILEIKKAWEEKYGLTFEQDTSSGLSWSADGGTFSARIYVLWGEELHVECANKKLEGKAFKAGMASW